jgi:preprotein translocase subunit SecF
MEFFRQTNIDFLKYRWWAIGLSWALIAVGLFTIFIQKGLKFGIDFSGGTAITLRFRERPDVDKLRALLDGAQLGEIGIQRYEEAEKNEVLVRVQQQPKEGRDVVTEVLRALRAGLQSPTDPSKIDLNTEGRATLATRLTAADPDHLAGKSDVNAADVYSQAAERIIGRRSQMGLFRSPADVNSVEGISPAVKAWVQANATAGPFVLLSAENVGPQVGKDLQKKAILAVVWSSIGMLAYIAVRFRSVPFGVGAIVATVHDLLITIGLLALFGREFNLIVVAALLTLVGYSVNDTVVVYDRVRENLKVPKKEDLYSVINRSINQTLSRTVLTSGATMLVVVALFFLGGEVLNTFALTLMIGIIVGTYSSIYVAAAIVVIWRDFQGKRKLAVVPAAAPVPATAAAGGSKPAVSAPGASSPTAAPRPQQQGKKKNRRR